MHLLLVREKSSYECTIGKMYQNGTFLCYTLEDVIRSEKIKGATAIPFGTYKITVNWSQRFQRPMPLLLDVPGFAGVRIHTGNTAKDTDGCILVGKERGIDAIYKSKAAYNDLFERIKTALNLNNEVTIEIIDMAEAGLVSAAGELT